MIAATLVPDEALQAQFDEPEDRFLYIAQIARKNLEEAINGGASGAYSKVDWNAQYVHELSEIGDALGIAGLPKHDSTDLLNSDQVASFDVSLARILTRIRINRIQPTKDESVKLSIVTKATISAELDQLRRLVNECNLSAALKASLHKKIDLVEIELNKQRSALQPLWILSGALMMLNGASDVTGTLADVRPALELVTSISKSFEADKKSELAEEYRLRGETLRLPHSETKALTDQR